VVEHLPVSSTKKKEREKEKKRKERAAFIS
jgi:hypothetical protein